MNDKEIIEKYFYEVWNKRNRVVAYEIISTDLKTRFLQSHGYGPEGIMNIVEARYKVFPDLIFQILDIVMQDAKVWSLYNFSGTHSGRFWNINPTNKKINYNGILMLEIKDGQIIKGDSIRDEIKLLEQIGYLEIDRTGNRQ